MSLYRFVLVLVAGSVVRTALRWWADTLPPEGPMDTADRQWTPSSREEWGKP